MTQIPTRLATVNSADQIQGAVDAAAVLTSTSTTVHYLALLTSFN